jgi:hypothetical protein
VLGLNLPPLQAFQAPNAPPHIPQHYNTDATIMGRWSHLDDDEDRLPAGMSRVGYDADTQTYSYRDSDGSFWEGAPGCKYGKLHRVQNAAPLPSVHIPVDTAAVQHRYVLHDYDYDDSEDPDPYDSDDNKSYTQGDDEKLPISAPAEKKELELRLPGLTPPTKAWLHNRTPQPQPHHRQYPPDYPPAAAAAPDKPLADLPGFDTKPTGGTTTTTISRESTMSNSDILSPSQKMQKIPSLLKRSTTFTRLTRFLSLKSSSSSSGAGSRGVPRRATVAGRNQPPPPPLASSEGGGPRPGRWPGQGGQGGAGSNSVPRTTGRATTFDEILGVDKEAQ